MNFLAPEALWLLAGVPLLIWGYWLLQRRAPAIRFSHVGWLKPAVTAQSRWRRHLPPLLILLALVVLIIGIGRPTAHIALPSQYKTIVLVIDTSLSMRATDVDPNRIVAAQAAARAFVEQIPGDVRIGLVEFGGTATAVQLPTSSREDLVAAIDRFRLQRGTATGSALYVALQMLFPQAGIDLEAMALSNNRLAGLTGQRPATAPARRPGEPPPPGADLPVVPPGSFESAVVILLSDGRRTTGPDPIEAAMWAADRGVKVYTVGFGTKEGATIDFGEWSFYVRLDEDTLKAVADITRGLYYHAGTSEDLQGVYRGLNNKLVLERQQTELTGLLSLGGALLATLAAFLSMLWYGRLD